MTNLDFVKELVSIFNIRNYDSKVNTNFVVEDNKIVVKFNCDQHDAKKYLLQMARDLVREHFPDEDAASNVFDLESFPFDFDKRWLKYDNRTGITRLTVPIDPGVVFNLKTHLVEEFEIDVKMRMIKRIDEAKPYLGKERIEDTLNANIKQRKMDPSSGYIACLLFGSANVQKYFVEALKVKMQEYGYNYLNFYDVDYKNKKIYLKDVENIGFIRSVIEVSKKMVGYNFNFPSNVDLKVRSYKNAMSRLIFCLTGIQIYRYYYDEFIDKDRISSGDNFVLIPAVKDGHGGLKYLDYMQADKINAKFSHDVLTNVRGQTENTQSDKFGEVYAFSDRQIALLIPIIIENSVINKYGQLELNPELLEQLRSQPPLTEMSDTELESSKHNQEKQIKESPRQDSKILPLPIDSSNQSQQSLGADKPVQEASIWLQQKDHWLSQGTHEDKWLQSLQPGPSGLFQQRPSLWPQVSSSVPLSLEGAQASTNKWGISEKEKELIEDEKAISNPSGKQGKSNAVDADESSRSGKFSKAKSEEDRVSSKSGSGSRKKCKALQSESSSSKCADELEQGASGGSRKLPLSDRAKEWIRKRFLLRRNDKNRSSTKSTPAEPVSEIIPLSPPRSLRESSPSSEVGSPAHIKDVWQLSEVVEKSAPAEDKVRLLKPEAPIRKISTSSQKSDDSGFKSSDPSPRMSLNVATFAKSKPNPWLDTGDEELSPSLPGLNNTLEPSVKSKPFSLPRASLINKAPTSSSNQKFPTQSGEHIVTSVSRFPHVPSILRRKCDEEPKSQGFSVHTPSSALWEGVSGSPKSKPPGKLSSPKVEEQKQQVPGQKSVWYL